MRFTRIVGLMLIVCSIMSMDSVEAARYRRVQMSRSQNVCKNGQCSTRTSYSSRTTTHGGSLQQWAEEEARMMSERGTCGHIRPAPMGTFVGVGCGTTCMGSGTLVAEATVNGKMVRVWQR